MAIDEARRLERISELFVGSMECTQGWVICIIYILIREGTDSVNVHIDRLYSNSGVRFPVKAFVKAFITLHTCRSDSLPTAFLFDFIWKPMILSALSKVMSYLGLACELVSISFL